MINVIAAIGKTEWEPQFVSALAHPMTGIQVQRRCVDALDVLAVVKVLACEAVIISDHTLRVTAEFIAEINRQGIRLIALTSNPENFSDLGQVECLTIEESNPLAAISMLAALVRVDKVTPILKSESIGELILVCGFGGGTGKTRTAMEVAAYLAKLGKSTLLVDGDTYGPALLQMFGLPINTPGLLEVCRKIERKAAADNLIRDSSLEICQNLNLISGLTKSSRWLDLRLSALQVFWELALSEFEFVVVDGGPVLQAEAMANLETGLPRRNLVSQSALSASRTVLITSRRDESSITRLIKGVTEFQTHFARKQLSVVALGPINPRNRKEVISAVQIHAGISDVNVIDFDYELINQVEYQRSFVIHRKESQLQKQYISLTCALLEPTDLAVSTDRLKKLIHHQKVKAR
jgi:MinD-like ATPase involved in chromosome partitioning or flagellar assembly